MSLSRVGRLSPTLVLLVGRTSAAAPIRPFACKSWQGIQTRSQHNDRPRPRVGFRRKANTQVDEVQSPLEERYQPPDQYYPIEDEEVKIHVRYLRPAIWALLVSGGIFTGLAYLEAKKELKPKKSSGWFEAPQWGMQRRTAPTPTEMATQWWGQLNSMSKLSCGIIAANSAVHLSSFVAPRVWDSMWHIPARNVNYTLLTSAFVHSGPMHLFVNMYATYNFLLPVGYSRAFEGNTNHVLSFFLATGVISGFAQHWATLITPQKRAIPEALIRCGGASGALLGILGVFCMEYPNAGLGIIFIPVHFDAQYVLPAVMLFDFIGMIRGYSFVNFGHAVSCPLRRQIMLANTRQAHLSGTLLGVGYSYFNGKDNLWKPLVRFWERRLQKQ
jgi:rhomboid-like protein